MNTEQERADFEAWAADKWPGANFSPDQNNCGIVVPERYKHPKLQAAWEAYQAGRAAQARPEVPGVTLDGCLETLFRLGEYLGIDYAESRKAPGAPSDVYIKAIEAKIASRQQNGAATGECKYDPTVADQAPAASTEPFGHVWRASDTTAVIKLVGDPRIRDGMPVYAAPVVAQPSVLDGWKLVPEEPTMEMLYAARKADKEYQARMGLPDTIGVGAYDHYVAMLEAAPVAAQPAEPVQSDCHKECVIGDSNYAAGMLLGWNLCIDNNEEKFNRIRRDRLRAAAQASHASKAHDATPQPEGAAHE